MKRNKKEQGSITLFVLISITFFIIILVGLYVSTNNRIQKQKKELQQIEDSYITENIDNIYNVIVTITNEYTTVSTCQELKSKINRTLTINLNGYSYMVGEQNNTDSSIVITGENTEVIIEDTSKEKSGAITTKNTDLNKNLISIENNAKLILKNIEISNENLNNRNTKIIYVKNNSNFILDGGALIGIIEQEGDTIINSGKIIGNIMSKDPTKLSIEGGNIEGKVRLLNGIDLRELSPSAEITGGTINTYIIVEDNTDKHGNLTCKINNKSITYADVGDRVYLSATADENYNVNGYEIYKENDTETTVELLEDNSFIMPDYKVKVKVIYTQDSETPDNTIET